MTRFDLYLAALLALSCSCMNGRDGLDGGRDPDDCDDPDRPAWLDWTEVVPDEDGDGVGAGPVQRMCLAVGERPDGWVPAGGPEDCAPDDASSWSLRTFAGRDADSDGIAVAIAGEICTGGELPAGYLESAPIGEIDCDDRDPQIWRVVPLFADPDEDGFGAGKAVATCIGQEAPAGHSPAAGDCAPNLGEAWALLGYSDRDADGDGFTVPEEGQVCTGSALPPGYATSPGEGAPDCDDGDRFRFQIWTVYPDSDRDGFGTGALETVCAASRLPDGYAFASGDCAAEDPARWRTLSYSHRDSDLDTYAVVEAGTVCSGTSLPSGHRRDVGAGVDCDDTDPLRFLELSGYADTDGDGHGAGEVATFCTAGALPAGVVATGGDCAPGDAALHTPLVSYVDADGDGVGAGDQTTLCTAGTRPPGYVAVGGDCAPADGAAWRVAAYGFVDRDEDGRTAAESGQVCTGADLPPPYRDSPGGNDCDDDDPALLAWAVLYEDGDGDGVGAGSRSILCIGASAPADLSIHGDDADDEDPFIQSDQEDDDELELILS